MDLVHNLAFQTVKFCKSLRQSNNTMLYNTFMCFSRERDCNGVIENTFMYYYWQHWYLEM